jgi:hypothetical protein
MSHTVPSQHPAVVLRSNYQHLRALLAIAIAVILGLTIAVVVLATSNSSIRSSVASPATPSAIQANPSAETGAKLDHSGRNTAVPQATVQPNPDQQGVAVSPTPLGSNSSYYYPGHR